MVRHTARVLRVAGIAVAAGAALAAAGCGRREPAETAPSAPVTIAVTSQAFAAGAAAIAGRVDAAVTYEPYLTVALKQGKGFHLIYTAGQRPGIISDLHKLHCDHAPAGQCHSPTQQSP